MERTRCRVASARRPRSRVGDEEAMTAVVEFLSAFVLFLVIVSAFLSISQLKLGSNVAESDRFDQMAIDGLERLTDSKGHVVIQVNGSRDTATATDDWHLLNASVLLLSNHLPGLGDGNGRLDPARIAALANVTEINLIHGLGIQDGLSLNLTITVMSSPDQNRVGLELFADGSPRVSATRGSTASRTLYMGDEQVRITLEVHDAGRVPSGMRITEFMADPSNGPPEWVEIENPDGFAVNITGWSIAQPGAFSMIGSGAIAGGDRLICTGNALTQYNPTAAMMFDLHASGVLGTGGIDTLSSSSDTIVLGYTLPGTALTQTVMSVTWDHTWNIGSNQSMTYNMGGSPNSATNWTSAPIGTPGW